MDQHQLYTDACLTGMGGFFGGNQYVIHSWDTEELRLAFRVSKESMPFLELLALIHCINIWKEQLRGKGLILLCDCEPVVKAINKGRSFDPGMMKLIRLYIYITNLYNIFIICKHIAGYSNVFADLLSRSTDNQEFLQHPQLIGVPLLQQYIQPFPIMDWFN
jgi:hypothetical protein